MRACMCVQAACLVEPISSLAGDAGFDRMYVAIYLAIHLAIYLAMYVAIYLAGGVRRMRAGADAELGPGAW